MHMPLCLWRSGGNLYCVEFQGSNRLGSKFLYPLSNLAGLNWGFSKSSSYLLESKIIL